MKLQIVGITKSFAEKQVLREISFDAQDTSAFGLLGRNGAGKTTAIRIIMNVFAPDSGEVLLDGKPLKHSGANIGYLPEERGLYPKHAIGEQMVYFGMLRGMEKRQSVRSVKAWLERFDMAQYYDKKLDVLSKGNQQKIQLAVALINDPDIIILDEPFSGLDPVNAQLLKDVVRECVQSHKLVLFSSHQMGYVEEFCDSIALLNGGKIVLQGNLEQIKRSYPRENLLIEADAGLLQELQQDERLCAMVRAFEQTERGMIVRLRDARDKRFLLQAAAQSGYDVDRFEVMEPTLEQIFVEKAGDAV